jgi:glutamyl-tRNA(Gln) amidotransferase subunit D
MEKKSFAQGDKYRVLLKDNSHHEGVFVFENDLFIYLKLASGYNIGISKEKIESFERIESKEIERKEKNKSESKDKTDDKTKDSEEKKGTHAHNKEGTEILILHTGGTIASKVDYSTGAVHAKFTPDEMLDLFPELRNIAKIDSKLVRNMWSDDMRFAHYNILAKEIEKALNNNPQTLKGVILTHGTDTLHYTASALSFIFEKISIPVVLVGSQRSSDRPSSDAALNLLSAAFFISKAEDHNIKGVFICMHESNDDKVCVILPAQNIKKLHSSRRDAFKAVNGSAVARINFEHKEFDIVAGQHFHAKSEEELKGKEKTIEITKEKNKNDESKHSHKTVLKLFNPDIKVGIIRSRPNLYPEEFKVYEHFDGLILEGTGLGHFPIEEIDEETELNKQIFAEIKKIASKKVVAMTTQTVFGRVNLNVYSPGRMLKDTGILGHNLDMITETAYLKLAWLLSNYDIEETKKLYSENLRGEITERSEKEEFL